MARRAQIPRATNELGERTRSALESGETPLEYMLRVMRDDTANCERRDRMAVVAAPYFYAKVPPAAPQIEEVPRLTEIRCVIVDPKRDEQEKPAA
jgi:hypothetical protein